jgi:hypothetical protein
LAQVNALFERVRRRTLSPLEAIDELEDIGVDIRLQVELIPGGPERRKPASSGGFFRD